MRIGVLTGGGDCPGLNSTIRSIYYKSRKYGYEVFGFFEGWKGVIENSGRLIELSDVEEIENLEGQFFFHQEQIHSKRKRALRKFWIH